MGALNYGDRAAREVSQRLAAPVATLAALKAMIPAARADGMQALCQANGFTYIYSAASVLANDDQLVIEPTDGAGAWLLAPGFVALTFPIGFATADAAVLYTMPTGALLHINDLNWRIATSFTGGTSSAIGVSSTKTGFTTKGDLLGGAAGDVAAALTSTIGVAGGTIGVGMNSAAKVKGALWKATDILRFDRITDAFTAGVGSVVVEGNLILNAGA